MKNNVMKVLLIVAGVVMMIASIPYIVSCIVFKLLSDSIKGKELTYSIKEFFDEISWMIGQFVDEIKGA